MGAETQLWAAVLMQAVEDFRSDHASLRSRAEDFFRGPDFEQVCAFVGLDPDVARYRLRRQSIEGKLVEKLNRSEPTTRI